MPAPKRDRRQVNFWIDANTAEALSLAAKESKRTQASIVNDALHLYLGLACSPTELVDSLDLACLEITKAKTRIAAHNATAKIRHREHQRAQRAAEDEE